VPNAREPVHCRGRSNDHERRIVGDRSPISLDRHGAQGADSSPAVFVHTLNQQPQHQRQFGDKSDWQNDNFSRATPPPESGMQAMRLQRLSGATPSQRGKNSECRINQPSSRQNGPKKTSGLSHAGARLNWSRISVTQPDKLNTVANTLSFY
jgi:hypothetical protein